MKIENGFYGNNWILQVAPDQHTFGETQARRFLVKDWRYLGFTANIELTVLSSEAYKAWDDQVKREFAATAPELKLLVSHFFAFAKASGQRTGLNGLITFSSGRRVIVTSHFPADVEATADGGYLYYQQVGNPQVFRLDSLFLHPAQALDALNNYRQHADKIWTADLPIPVFPQN